MPSSLSPSVLPSSYFCPSLSHYSILQHPPLHPLFIPQSLSPFRLSHSLFPPLLSVLPGCSSSPPFSATLFPPSSPPSLRISGPSAGSSSGGGGGGSGGGSLCAPTSVYSDNRDWERAVWLSIHIHWDFIKSILETRVM